MLTVLVVTLSLLLYAARRAVPSKAGHAPRPAILVVEDDTTIGPMLQSSLAEGLPATVDLATTAREADAVLTLRRYDALVVDLALPDGSGLDLVSRVRGGRTASNRAIPILVASGYTAPENAKEVYGADHVFQKPYDIARVVKTTASSLRQVFN